MDQVRRQAAVTALRPLIGTWELQAQGPFAGAEPIGGHAVFEWELGGRFVIERVSVAHPDAPDSVAIIAPEHDGDGFIQHYFDDRGVVRRYAMTLRDGVWTLLRDRPDDSPLDFSQRYVGRFDPDGAAIRGAWEIAHDHVRFEKDFELDYVRVA